MGFLLGRSEDRCSPLAGLAPRLFTGYFFLKYGLTKVTGGFGGEGLRSLLAEWRSESRYDFYVPFMDAILMPFADVIAFVTMWAEVLIGVLLLLGLFTRGAALAGILLCANFAFATGAPLLSTERPIYFTVLLLTVYLTAAGRVLGLDSLLRGVLPRWST